MLNESELTQDSLSSEQLLSNSNDSCSTVWIAFSMGHPWSHASTLARVLTGCHLGHVCVGDQRGIFDPTFSGDHLRDWQVFVHDYPMLQVIVEIPVPKAIDPREFPRDRRRTRLPGGLAYFFSRGRYPNRNCVTRVREYLAACGLVLPRSIVTPRDLYEDSHQRAVHECAIDPNHAVYCRTARIAGFVAPVEGVRPGDGGFAGRPERTAQSRFRRWFTRSRPIP